MWHVLLRLHTNDCLMRCCLWACLLVSQLARFMKKNKHRSCFRGADNNRKYTDFSTWYDWTFSMNNNISFVNNWGYTSITSQGNERPQQFEQKGLLSNPAWAPSVQSLCGARFPRFKDLMWIVICLSLLGCDRLATCPGCTPPMSAETGSSTICNLSRTSI